MSRMVVASAAGMLCLALLGVASCRTTGTSVTTSRALPDLTPTRLDYVDTDGFDALLETSLVNQDAVIVVRTGRTQPDWTGRLNAWIAAWNRGEHDKRKPIFRGQSPVPKVTVDGDSIREFRLLVGGLLDRAEETAQSGAAWWAEERARSRRVGLLKPYSLRFHLDEEESIQLVFFHGAYANHYSRHLQELMQAKPSQEPEWTRSVECSRCKKRDREGIDRLTSRGE